MAKPWHMCPSCGADLRWLVDDYDDDEETSSVTFRCRACRRQLTADLLNAHVSLEEDVLTR